MAGVTTIEVNEAAETSMLVCPSNPLKEAVIVVVPAASALANPFEPPALLMVATLVTEELQTTLEVMSLVEPSE